MLKPNGRLVFFLPTVTDEYEEIDIDTLLCEGMELVANSLQDFGSWGRRVSTLSRSVINLAEYAGLAHHYSKVNLTTVFGSSI